MKGLIGIYIMYIQIWKPFIDILIFCSHRLTQSQLEDLLKRATHDKLFL